MFLVQISLESRESLEEWICLESNLEKEKEPRHLKFELDVGLAIRRIKCDETKPVCLRCSSTGRNCDGYPPDADVQDDALDTHSTLSLDCRSVDSSDSKSSESESSSSAIVKNPTLFIKTESESRANQFFYERTIRQFSEFWNEPLWSQIVPRISQEEGSIRHALYALSSFHELYMDTYRPYQDASQREVAFKFALSQYNLAIKKLVAPRTSDQMPSLHVQLISCLIFVAIEALQRRYLSAITVFQYGARIMRQLRKEEPERFNRIKTEYPMSSESDLVSCLEIFFMRIEIQMMQVLNPKLSRECALSFVNEKSGKLLTPEDSNVSLTLNDDDTVTNEIKFPSVGPFNSMEEVRQSLERLSYVCHIQAPLTSGPAYKSYAVHFKQWSTNFDEFVKANHQSFTLIDQRSAALLEVHKRHIQTSLTMAMSGYDITKWDDLLPVFEELVHYAEKAIELQSSTDNKNPPRFQPDTGIITPLYAAIQRCRDPTLRRKALALLKRCPRQEGIWNSVIISRIAEKVIDFEENGLDVVKKASDVPEHARISSGAVEIDPFRKHATVRYSNQRNITTDEFDWA